MLWGEDSWVFRISRVHTVIQVTRKLNSTEHQLPAILVTRIYNYYIYYIIYYIIIYNIFLYFYIMVERDHETLLITWRSDDARSIQESQHGLFETFSLGNKRSSRLLVKVLEICHVTPMTTATILLHANHIN